jgi:hypothetical protein
MSTYPALIVASDHASLPLYCSAVNRFECRPCEIARRPKGSRGPFFQALRAHVRRLEQYIPGRSAMERRQKTIALFTGMAGTLTVARAFTDERDRRRILDGARKFYLAATRA